jgi:mono/diheme cytochrome c family protein
VRVRLIISFAFAGLCGLVGCSQPEAEFALSEHTKNLIAPAKKTVEDALAQNFGTPNDLVAWTRFPIEYGGHAGTVREAQSDDETAVAVDFDPPLEDEALQSGATVRWLSGKQQGNTQTIASYNPATGFLKVSAAMDPSPGAGDSFVVGFGQTLKSGRKLYMTHCMHCHGVAGDGAGPTAKYLNPRPRDYRLGLFKFTSTAQPERATRADLKRIVKQGIPGTYMPSFLLLEDDELTAIIAYVRWLACRGETEKKLADDLSGFYSKEAFTKRVESESESDPDDARLIVLQELFQSIGYSGRVGSVQGANRLQITFDSEVQDVIEYEQKQLQAAITAGETAEAPWLADKELVWITGQSTGKRLPVTAYDAVTGSLTFATAMKPAPTIGDRFFIHDSEDSFEGFIDETTNDIADFWTEAEDESVLVRPTTPRTPSSAKSIARGRELFLSKKVNCVQCHGPHGRGDGPMTEAFQKKPNSEEKYPEPGLFDIWGNKSKPRDLTRGLYRGGRRPLDLYRRVRASIKGTGMPAFNAQALPDKDLWDLVNYVMSIPFEKQAGHPAVHTQKPIKGDSNSKRESSK